MELQRGAGKVEKSKVWITKFDETIFYLLNQQPKLLIQICKWITHLGGATISISMLIILWFLGPLELQLPVIAASLSLTVSHLIVMVTKKMVCRPRPYLSNPQAATYGIILKDHSFPSGHSTAIFAVFTPFILYDSFLAPFLLVIAIMVALTRVILGIHYPTDVVVGCLLGGITGFGFCSFLF